MKILAIRGRDLASLEGDFALELADEPLASAGLFAITGPTGAGKSTLLDALCVALFDRTPRLDARGGALIGRPGEDEALKLGEHDVRSLLRRGAGSGEAQVDFEGQDGRRYRATWRVRRAREKPDGRFQPQTLELVDLEDDGVLGGTKTETLEAIEERLGLTFAQFRRSALLAQGDFAAFLKADAKERADLLERMTGTEVFGRLSIAAFQRARDEDQALKVLQARREELAILEPAARESLEAELAERASAQAEAAAVAELATAALAWLRALAERRAAEGEAARAVKAAEEAWEGAEGLRSEVAAARAARPIAAQVAAADAAEQARAKAAGELERRREAAQESAEAVSTAATTLEAAERALETSARALDDRRPALAKARELEEAGRHAASKLAEAEAAAAEARRAAVAAKVGAEAIAAEVVDVERRRAGAQAWLVEHPEVAPAAAQWERWRAELERLSELVGGLAELDGARGAIVDAADAANEALAAATEAAEAAEQAAREARPGATDPDAALDAVRDEGRALDARRDRLASASQLIERARQVQVDQDTADDAVLAAREEARRAQEAQGELARELAASGAAVAEARRGLERAVAARELQAHRASLDDGAPCPLCGATEHPWAHDVPTGLLALEQETRERVLALEATHRELERRSAGLAARRDAAAEAAGQAERTSARADEELGRLAERWAKLPRVPGGIELPSELPVERLDALGERIAGALVGRRADLEGLEATERLLVTWRTALDARDEAARAASDAARRVAEDDRERQRLVDARRRAVEALAEALAGFDGWRDGVLRDPGGWRERLEAKVAAWREHQDAVRVAGEALAELAPRRSAALERAEMARESAEAAEAAREAQRERHAAVAGELREILGGRPAAEVEAELVAAVEAARTALEAARLGQATAAQRAGAARERADEAAAALAGAEEAARTARAALEEALAAAGLEEAAAREHLSRPPGWLEAQEASIAELRDALGTARAVLKERRERREAHEEARPDGAEGEPEAVAARAEAAAEALEEARRRCDASRVALARDDEARQRAEALAPEIDAQQERCRVWSSLSELIGQSDGKKFRVFAQSLTLDVLIAHANVHLQELSRRYRLARVPGHDLDLQIIDRDLGDEVRSVGSLSGGETFLVSLALALGLSSLSARQTAVRSLFIDEGFGTLDPRTLEVALAALDSLQATGCQVGLISHVPGLAERVGVQVRVVPQGAGRSRVDVVSPG